MNFLEISVATDSETAEMFMAEMAELGFDTFEEDEEGFKAYIEEGNFNDSAFDLLYKRYKDRVRYRAAVIPKLNWNEAWEKNFSAVTVSDRCRVRASFHDPDPRFPLEIVINPKMSFGTGHHATTVLMLEHLLETDCRGKAVVDAGCGTGILAIAAAKSGANRVVAFDTDEWAVENARENIALNGCENIEVSLDNVALLQDKAGSFDIILANIQLNVLLNDLKVYAPVLRNRGVVFMSGFYEEDIPVLISEALKYRLELFSEKKQNNWAALGFIKS